jgi:CheY-like chemotaxis protein
VKDGRILVVDDEPMVRQSLGQFLGDEGYTVEEAADGADALARVGEHRPDVILLDLMMPGMNGRQFLRALRGDPRYADVPVVVMTAVRGLTVQPAVLGASEVVEKPFDVDDLLNKVALAIYRSRGGTRGGRGAAAEGDLTPPPAAAPSAPMPAPSAPRVASEPPPAVAADAPSEKGVVLVVDHSRTSLQRLDALLSNRGYTVVSLTRITPQLTRLARVLQPRAILLDVIDAAEEEIVESMRADRALDNIPIVVFARADRVGKGAIRGPAPGSAPIDDELLRFLDRVS